MTRCPRRLTIALARLLALVCLCAGLAACGGGHHAKSSTRPFPPVTEPATPHASPVTPARVRARGPNIIFVLTDDLSLDLLRFMPHVKAMQRDGLTFRNYFVSDSLCCPSRASIFTGRFPHNTHVFSNFGQDGGFGTFYRRGEEQNTFNVRLQRAGYRTALLGKYLNGYLARPGHITDGSRTDAPATYVPPGWSEWDAAGWGYPEYNYTLNQNGALHSAGHEPKDYLTNVLSRLGVSFIDQAAATRQPFFLETATFAPHAPYTPAPRDVNDFPRLKAPRPPSFNRLPAHAPNWLAYHRRLTLRQIRRINRVFRLRARSVQAVDRMIGSFEQALRFNHIAQDTYLVFSSDNGLHTGEYRLMPGKLTAFDTDIHVPLIVVGPHVPAASSTGALAENVDLAETFAALAGVPFAGDGHSLLPLLRGQPPRGWRSAVLVEHHGPDMSGLDPDFQLFGAGNPRTYEAMRTASFLYVEYDDGEREYYDLGHDPFELDNIAWRLPPSRLRTLHRELRRLERCRGQQQCWLAMHAH